MALIVIQTADGKGELVHSSIFDPPPRIPWEHPDDRLAAWQAVWRRVDETKKP